MLQNANVLISKNGIAAKNAGTKKKPHFWGFVAFPGRLERPAYRLGGGRSVRLSYGNTDFGEWLLASVRPPP